MIAFVLFAIAIVSITATNEADEVAIGPCVAGLCPDGYECRSEECVKLQTTEDVASKIFEDVDSVQS
uniref:EB domain-containing protein n=1 Tax=Ascaris lumbricoides TaxID=6252 RepID=A0A0M3HYP9_ASCLU